jgi:hypothetical protein
MKLLRYIFTPFVANPELSFLIALLFFMILLVGLFVFSLIRVGRPIYLLPPTLLWFLNGFWELGTFPKHYPIDFDLYLLYPVLISLSIFLLTTWTMKAVSQVQQTVLEVGKFEETKLLRFIRLNAGDFFEKYPISFLELNIIPFSGGALIFLVFCASIGAMTAQVRADGAVIGGFLAICVLFSLGTIWYLFSQFNRRANRSQQLEGYIRSSVDILNDKTTRLKRLIDLFESKISERFNSRTTEMEAVHNHARKIYFMVTARITAIEKLLAGEIDQETLLAAQELLASDIFENESAVFSILDGEKIIVLSPENWIPSIERAYDELVPIYQRIV